MSPLLAAVNDITRRDIELQHYFQNLEKAEEVERTLVTDVNELLTNHHHHHHHDNDCTPETEPFDNFDDETDFAIADKPVECRAKASLPTQYLKLGSVNTITNEPIIIAKKSIPQRIKFGPYEGITLKTNNINMDILLIQTPRYHPLLMLDEYHMLDISNENESNWMRYIRLADNFAQQNLHLFLENRQLYVRTTRDIAAKEELRIGYGYNYSMRFLLRMLQPTLDDIVKIESRSKHRQSDNNTNNIDCDAIKQNERNIRPKRLLKRSVKINKTINSNVEHLKKVHNKIKSKLKSNKKQKTATKACQTQSTLIAENVKPFTCHICEQKCLTATALQSHQQSHTGISYNCIYCQQTFNYVRAFNIHVKTHQNAIGRYKCQQCLREYKSYHLVRKHVRLFHTEREFDCYLCDKKFSNMNNLIRHKLVHSSKKQHICQDCGRKFLRKDQLKSHQKRMHANEKVQTAVDHKQTDTLIEVNENENYLCYNLTNNDNDVVTQQTNDLYTLPSVSLADILSPILLDTKVDRNVQENNVEETLPNYYKTDVNNFTTNHTNTMHLYPFKCHLCINTYFKRRGIYINHFTRMHPDVNINELELLKQPLMKPQLIFNCPYCKNVYKCNSKRKQHIQKHHPNNEIPISLRYTTDANKADAIQIGNIVSDVYKCEECPSQYTSRNRIIKHYRKTHPHHIIPKYEKLPEIYKVNVDEGYYRNDEQHQQQHQQEQHQQQQQQQCNDDVPFFMCNMNLLQKTTETVATDATTVAATTSSAVTTTFTQQALASPENKLLKLSSAALELSRFDFLNERSTTTDLPWLFDDDDDDASPLVQNNGDSWQ